MAAGNEAAILPVTDYQQVIIVSNQTDERRQYQRVPFIAEVIMDKDGEQWSCELLDISLKGVLLEAPQGIDADMDATYEVELVLGEDVAIRMQANISHTNNHHWGLQWKNIDVEGLSHLRRLLELNMTDGDEMHRELAELG